MTDAKMPDEAPPSKATEEAAVPVSDEAAPPKTSPNPSSLEGETNGEAADARDADAPADVDPPPATDERDPKPSKKKKKSAKSGAKADTKDEDESPLLERGNPLRRVRGGVTAGLGCFFAYLLMAHNGQLRVGVPLGTLFIAIASWGLMDLLGTFDDPDAAVAASTDLRVLGRPVAQALASFALFCFALAGAASGYLPQGLWGAVVPLTFLVFVAAVFDLGVKLGPWKTDELGLARPLWHRHGFWLVAAATLLYLPFLGSYSLWDPWETHYGEVAREILARDDWVSLWWAQDGWFWSKPILNFWMQALAMATLGLHYQPDMMLVGPGGIETHPEWIVRAPNFLLVVLAMYLLYKGAAKVFGRRAALIGGLVLATMPDWYFLAHQTMADMPFVASMTGAMGLLLLGLNTDAEQRAKVYEVRVGKLPLRLSGWHLVFGAILICALPQILYLVSRNLELIAHGSGPKGFHAHWDEFKSGSAGNCGLPGNEACNVQQAASIPPSVRGAVEGIGPTSWRLVGAFEPVLQALLWSAVIGTLLYLNWGERRVRRLYYLAAWFFAAIATMGKGPAGFGLPMICAFAYVATTRRWGELLRLELVSGLLIIFGVAIPWYVAMYVRHGSPFTDRLIFHDMFNRAFHHVHDTNEGDDTSFRFYVWQLGYAIFPWTGLAPIGLLYWLRRGDAADRGKGDASVMLVMWFLFAFALFSFMGTKFHHYIFPAVPPIAVLLGVVLDDVLGEGPLLAAKDPTKKRSLLVYFAGITAGVGLLVAGVTRFWPGSILGTKGTGGEITPASPLMACALSALGLGVLAACVVGYKRAPQEEAQRSLPGETLVPYHDEDPAEKAARARVKAEDDRRKGHERLMLAGAFVAGALVLAIVGRDLIGKPDNADQPGAIRLLHLFTYNYRRPWPDTLDFSAVLAAFTLVAVALGLALSVAAIRRHVVVAVVALGLVWAVWGLDAYMTKTAPHWGQHEVIAAYYASRNGPDEPLVAYQMNWKGENFYTGNHVPAFVSSGATFTNWMKTQREKGVHVMYFVTEHGRVGGLKSEVAGKSYREVTDKALDNKFVLVRAEL